MNGTGTVEAIHLAPESGADVESVGAVEALAGRGLRGDRHFGDGGGGLTLIESEALAAAERDGFELRDGRHRRNVTTSDTALNHLVGERFRVGDVVCEGVELCEPCRHLESLTREGVVSELLHRGGLRADVVESGTLERGDEIEPL
ncbi:MOSC domain-containing protein [Halorussus marinus]|uniref:MOSC domain-containing protein n=1 Tax=Halorussus marinus TaxID=2505976 RepID=UPI00106E2322|nr:MOSC domain-containing protein [Halorussus marinus]